MSEYTPLFDDVHMQDEAPPARVVIAVDGTDKVGKTRFALSAPKPLMILDFDMGTEGVAEARHPLVIRTSPFAFRHSEVNFVFEEDPDKRKEQEARRHKKIMRAATPVFERFYTTYHKGLTEPALVGPHGAMKLRTMVIDTGSEAWELLRLVEFGKVTKVMPHHYTEVNAKMRDLVRAALESDVNVIWLHQLDRQWKEGLEGKARKTDVLERVGFKRMANLVQANVLLYRLHKRERVLKWAWGEEEPIQIESPVRPNRDLGFRLHVGNCRQDPTLEGLELANEAITFRALAMMLQPGTTAADWGDSE